MRRIIYWLIVLTFTGCAGSSSTQGDGGTGASDSGRVECGVAPGAPCCVPFGLSGADMAGTACAPGLACAVPDGGQTHADHGTCEVAP